MRSSIVDFGLHEYPTPILLYNNITRDNISTVRYRYLVIAPSAGPLLESVPVPSHTYWGSITVGREISQCASTLQTLYRFRGVETKSEEAP
jgi:hypothetical protein